MNSREIRRRIASVKETVKITKAMYSISVAKTMKGKRILPDAKRFFEENRRVFSEIACLSGASYFRARGERAAFVVIGGEKGLCGDYNQRVFESARAELLRKKERYLFTVGTLIRELLNKGGFDVDVDFLHSAESYAPESAYAMAADLISLYDEDMLDEIYLIYSRVEGNHSVVACEKLLPFDKGDARYEQSEPLSEEVVLKALLHYLSASIYHALVSSALAENLARVKAMSQATKNGEEMIADLTAKYNKVRQETITRALQDVGSADQAI